MFYTIKQASVRRLLRNVSYLLTRELQHDLRQPELRRDLLYLKILHLPEPWATTYREEIDYIRREGVAAFPYEAARALEPIRSGRDAARGLPYVMHRDRRLYFPRNWSEARAAEAYARYIAEECLLGGGYRRKAPHQYVTETFRVREGDTVFDIGAAEGLFALDCVGRARRVVLIEADRVWAEPLAATFAPDGDRVRIVIARVGARAGRGHVRLSDLLKEERPSRCFMKMDVEGAEGALIEEASPFLASADGARIACCVYHRRGDEERIRRRLEEWGYAVHTSDGWMLFPRDPDQAPPFFRRGVLRAERGA
jgi:hypothetical protein